MPEQIFMKLGIYVYVMEPEPIATAYIINPSHQSVCLYVYAHIIVRQRLAKHIPVETNTRNNKKIVGRVVLTTVRVASKESLWVCPFTKNRCAGEDQQQFTGLN
jgi:hypothetical protein